MIKKNISKTLLITIFLIAFLSTQNAISEEKTGPTDGIKSWRLSLGYGIALKNNIRKDNNYSGGQADVLFNHIPLVQIAWGPISIGAQGLSANLVGNREVAGYLNINRVGDRYYATGMENRSDSWFFGAGLKYHKLNFLLARDINGRSHGVKATIHYVVLYPLGKKIFVRSSAGIECYNRSFAEYYYGVRSNEATSNRSEYHPKAYCLPTASFFPGYKYSEDINFLMGVSLKGLTQAVRKSPTTNGTWLEEALILGATWKF
ncbi:MAG: MipA/OmpV family protein [Bacteriovorax sp.]|nr:MipA/OmpV family protein [Bacteriovorax sp.]